MEKEDIKKYIILAGAFLLILIIIIVSVLYYQSYKEKKRLQEQAERAANLKADKLLELFSKKDWESIIKDDCELEKKEVYENSFSWLSSLGEDSDKAELMNGYNLNIFFKNKNDNQTCCGNIKNVQEKTKMFFLQNEFRENSKNTKEENFIYAFENNGLKCIYGYRDVQNQEIFCEMGIICGRINESLTKAYFQEIYNIFNEESGKEENMVVVDTLKENLEGRFAKGKVGYSFYLDTNIPFIAKEGTDRKKTWFSIDNPKKTRKIYNCDYLVDHQIPPSIAIEPFCEDKKGNKFDYSSIYPEK